MKTNTYQGNGSPIIRRIYQPVTITSTNKNNSLSCAYHISNAFEEADLDKLNALRLKIPHDLSRPTCPRRFLTEKQDASHQFQQDGWVGRLIDETVASWKLDDSFCCLPWYRFLEYNSGGHMDKHTDGSNVHPETNARSVATMLIYLSTCRSGGATTLYLLND
jgi:hypothetical protein